MIVLSFRVILEIFKAKYVGELKIKTKFIQFIMYIKNLNVLIINYKKVYNKIKNMK